MLHYYTRTRLAVAKHEEYLTDSLVGNSSVKLGNEQNLPGRSMASSACCICIVFLCQFNGKCPPVSVHQLRMQPKDSWFYSWPLPPPLRFLHLFQDGDDLLKGRPLSRVLVHADSDELRHVGRDAHRVHVKPQSLCRDLISNKFQ